MENPKAEPSESTVGVIAEYINLGDLSLGGAKFNLDVPIVQDIETKKAHLYDAACGMSRHLNGAENIPGFLGTVQMLGTILLSRQAMGDIEEQCPDIVDRADRLSQLRNSLKDRVDEIKEIGKALKIGLTEIENIIYGMTKFYGHTMRQGDAEKAKRERQNAKDRKDGDVDFEEDGAGEEAPKATTPKKRGKKTDKEAPQEPRPNFENRTRLFNEEPNVGADAAAGCAKTIPLFAGEGTPPADLAASDKAEHVAVEPEIDLERVDEGEVPAEPTLDPEPGLSPDLLDDDNEDDFLGDEEEEEFDDTELGKVFDNEAPSATTHGKTEMLTDEELAVSGSPLAIKTPDAPAPEDHDDDEFAINTPLPLPLLEDAGFNRDLTPVEIGYEDVATILILRSQYDALSDARQDVLDKGFEGNGVFAWNLNWNATKSHDGQEYVMVDKVPWSTARLLVRVLKSHDREGKSAGFGLDYTIRAGQDKPAVLKSKAGAPPKMPVTLPE